MALDIGLAFLFGALAGWVMRWFVQLRDSERRGRDFGWLR